MKIKDLTIEELECMGYDEIAYLILEETGKKEKLLKLFEKICKLLELDFESQQEKISDFFELLSTNKKFIMLDNGYWDLQINHKVNITVEDAEEDIVDIDVDHEESHEEEPEEQETIFYDESDQDDQADDELANFVVIEDDEENASI